MIINELKLISTTIGQKTITVTDYDDNGEIVGFHEETVTREIPVMGIVYRDATPEEVAEQERMVAEMPPAEPSPEERISALEETNAMLLEALLEMSEEVYS